MLPFSRTLFTRVQTSSLKQAAAADNVHNPDASVQTEAVWLNAVDGMALSGNAQAEYLGTRDYSDVPLVRSCGTAFASSNRSGVALAAAGAAAGDFVVRRLNFANNDGWCWRNVPGRGLTNGGVLRSLEPPFAFGDVNELLSEDCELCRKPAKTDDPVDLAA